jgi:hypothetical protein
MWKCELFLRYKIRNDFHKWQRISWLAERLLFSQDGHCSVDLISYNFRFSYHESTTLVRPGLLHEVPRSHSFRHTTLRRNFLGEWSARRRDLYLTTHNSLNRQTSMAPVRFEPAIPVSKHPQTHALRRAATGISYSVPYLILLLRL